MPTWKISTPDGLTFRLTGDEPPDEATIQGIERQIRGEPAPEEVEPEIPETSAFGAFGRAAGENVLPSAGGAALGVAGGRWAGTLAGARAGAALPIPHPVAKVAGGLIGGLLGFLSTSWAQRKIAEKVAPEATKEFETLRASDVERHPVASFSGAVAGALPSTQFNPLSTLREASTLFRGAPGAGEAAVSLGAKLGLGAGFAAAPAVMEGRLPTGRELGEGAAFGAILGAPRRWVGGGPSARVVVPPPPPPPLASGRFAPRPTELEPQPPRLPGKEPIQPEFVPPGMLPRETRVVKPWITVPFTPEKPTSKPVVPEKNVMSKLKASRLARAAERLEEERQPKPPPVAPALGLEEAQGRLPGGAAVIEVPREPMPELHPAHVDLIETIVKVASDRKATLPHLYGAMEALPTARAVVEGHIGRLEQRGQDASRFYDVLQTLETFENSYHEAMTKPQVARGKATTRDILGEAQAKVLIDGLRKPPPEPPTEGGPPVPVEPVPPKTPPSPAELPPLRPGDKPIKIEQTQPDGSVTLIDAVTNDKNWEIGGKSIPNVGRPVEGLWSDGPLRPGEKIVGEPPPPAEAGTTVPKQPKPPAPPAPAAAEEGVLPEVAPPAKEPTLFSDNPKLARPVSWWRKFATVQGASKMGKDTRAALVQFTKVPNNPKAIADFISKRIGEVETPKSATERKIVGAEGPKSETVDMWKRELASNEEILRSGKWASGRQLTPADVEYVKSEIAEYKAMLARTEAKPAKPATKAAVSEPVQPVAETVAPVAEASAVVPEVKPTEPSSSNAAKIAELKRQLAVEQKKLDKNVAKMGSMVPPPIVAEVTRKIATRMAKIQDEIDALEQPPTPPPEPPKGPGGNVGMSAATPGEFTPPPQTDSFRGFSGWATRAKEVLQRVKEYFTPPHAGALPEVDIRPDAILPRLPAAHIENKIASSPQGMARVPGLGAIADPRATAHAPSDAPFLGRANSIAKGKTFATIWGQTQWANKDLFKVNPDTGTMPLTNGRQGHLSDVIEAEMRDPGSQPITINQYRWIHDEWIPLQKDVNKMLRDEGVREVHTDDMEFEVGKDYFPRPAIGKRNRPVTGPGGKPGGKPGARQFFQKSRKFATEEEGARPAAEGEAKETIIYDPDHISRVVKFISGAYRAVADHRLAIAPELGAGTVPEHWGVGRRVHAGPSFQGKVYPVEVAAKIEKAYGQEVSTPGRVLGEVTAAAKAVMATGDLSAPLIQGAAMFGRHPARWARSVAGSFKALFDSNYVARLMEQPRYKELRARASQSGVSLFQLQDFMSGTAEGQLATRLPVAGRVLKATGRAYGAFLDIAKLELFDAWSKVAPKSEWPRIAETVENSLFSGRMEQIGLNPHRTLGERLLFFAPSYYRGAGGLVATAFQNSVSGKMARQMLGGYAASGLLVSLGAYAALGLSEDEVTERLDPSKGKFLKIPVELADGSRVEVGIGNVLTQLVRLAGQAKDYHTEDKPIDTGVEANPYLRFLRARSAFMPSLAIELTTGRDYFGQRITGTESTVRHFMPFAIQSLFPREEASGQQRAMDSAFTFFGLNAYPEGDYQESLRKMDRLSYDTNQRPFSRSTPVQRAKIMGQFKRHPDYVKREPTPNDMERFIQIAEQRRRELASALPNETRKKMERLGLNVGGFKSTLRVNGQDVPLTESEREKYQQLLVEEYQRTIERLNEKAMLARRPDVLEKLWSSQREQIGIRARRRLLSELNRGKNGAK